MQGRKGLERRGNQRKKKQTRTRKKDGNKEIKEQSILNSNDKSQKRRGSESKSKGEREERKQAKKDKELII